MNSKNKYQQQSKLAPRKSQFRQEKTSKLFSIFGIFLYNNLIVTLIVLLSIIFNVVIVYVFTGKNIEFQNIKFYLGFLFVVTALTGIFPATYFAYLYYQRDRPNSVRLKADFKLLGLVNNYEYDNFDKIYKTIYDPMQFGSFIMLLTIISNVSFMTFFITRNKELGFITNLQASIVFYAFLGAYLFGVRLVIRRFNTSDLQPQVYASIILRIILSAAIAFGISTLIQEPFISTQTPQISPSISSNSAHTSSNIASPENPTREKESFSAPIRDSTGISSEEIIPWQILAFLIGIFPEQGLRWLVIIGRRAFRDSTINQYNERPLRKIIGINEWHEARLEELGIDDAQSLATANISKLLLTTQFNTMQVVNWIDQAILYMKVGAKIEQFISFQITTYHELYTLIKKIRLEIKYTSKREHERDNETETESETKLTNTLLAINAQLKATKSTPLWENDYNNLLVALGLNLSDLERLCDYSNYPNYIRIQEYYRNLYDVTREQAKRGTEEIIHSIDIGGEILEPTGDPKVESLSSEESEEISDQVKELRFQLSLNLTPRHEVDIKLRLGHLFYLLGDLDSALIAFCECLEDSSSSALDNETKSRAFVGRGLVNILLGNRHRDNVFGNKESQDYYREAQIYYQNAIRDNSIAIDLDPSNVDAFNNCAIAYIEQENFVLALENLEKALWLDKHNGVAYYNRGIIQNTIGQKQKDFMKAELDFERAYLLDYHPIALWAIWGLALINTGKYQEAISRLSQAISLTSNNFVLFSRRGFAYLQLTKEAKKQNLISTSRSYAKMARKDFDEAIYLVETDKNLEDLGQKIAPESTTIKHEVLIIIFLNYGHLETIEGNYNEVIKYYEKIDKQKIIELELGKEFFYNFANAYFQRGECKLKKKKERENKDQATEKAKHDFEEAICLFEQALEEGMSIPHIHYQLAVAYSRLKKNQEAQREVSACQKALQNIKSIGYSISEEELNFLRKNLNKLDGNDNIEIQKNSS